MTAPAASEGCPDHAHRVESRCRARAARPTPARPVAGHPAASRPASAAPRRTASARFRSTPTAPAAARADGAAADAAAATANATALQQLEQGLGAELQTSRRHALVAGQLGGLPAAPGQQLNATVSAQSLLQTPEQFRDVLLRTLPDGAAVRLGDVARVEIGAQSYGFDSRYLGRPATGVAVRLASGANAVDTARAVRARVNALKSAFPAGRPAGA